MSELTFILGGARSGKSRHAEALIAAMPPPWIYVATAQAYDAEMRARITRHQERRGADWRLIEEPLDIARVLAMHGDRPVLVDCLTLWLTNLMLGDRALPRAFDALEAALDAREAPAILVSNEIGLGIVPENALARAFRDEAGRLHQRMAARADRVLLMVAGLPMRVK